MESVRTRRYAICREAIQVGIGAPLVLHRYRAQSVEAAADGTVTACAGSVPLVRQPHLVGARSSSRATGSGRTGSPPLVAAGCAPGRAARITVALPRIFYREICA